MITSNEMAMVLTDFEEQYNPGFYDSREQGIASNLAGISSLSSCECISNALTEVVKKHTPISDKAFEVLLCLKKYIHFWYSDAFNPSSGHGRFSQCR